MSPSKKTPASSVHSAVESAWKEGERAAMEYENRMLAKLVAKMVLGVNVGGDTDDPEQSGVDLLYRLR